MTDIAVKEVQVSELATVAAAYNPSRTRWFLVRMSARAVLFSAVAGALLLAAPLAVSPAADDSGSTCDAARRSAVVRIKTHDSRLKGGVRVRSYRRLQTLAENPVLWIAHTGRDFGDEFVVCDKIRSRARRFATTSGGAAESDTQIDNVVLADNFLAYHESSVGDDNFDRFTSIDGVTGRTRYDTGKLMRSERSPAVSELVLSTSGAFASLRASEVRATDAAGTRVLASGGTVSALALGRGVLYWTQEGVPRSAVLAEAP